MWSPNRAPRFEQTRMAQDESDGKAGAYFAGIGFFEARKVAHSGHLFIYFFISYFIIIF